MSAQTEMYSRTVVVGVSFRRRPKAMMLRRNPLRTRDCAFMSPLTRTAPIGKDFKAPERAAVAYRRGSG